MSDYNANFSEAKVGSDSSHFYWIYLMRTTALPILQKIIQEESLAQTQRPGDIQVANYTSDLQTNVVVLSPCVLFFSQLQILSKGPSFVPSANFDLFQTLLDINKFTRLLTVKRHFLDGDLIDNVNVGNDVDNTIPTGFPTNMFHILIFRNRCLFMCWRIYVWIIMFKIA